MLHPYVAAGTPVVGLEPSCTAVWRSDAGRAAARRSAGADVAAGVLTLAELLQRTEGWRPPDLTGVELVAQPHCHHASVLGWRADAALLASTGATVTTVGGCCGLAGNFGVELGHYDVSVKVAEHDLLPAVTRAPGRRGAGRRLLLPDPAGRARRPAGDHPGRAAGAAQRQLAGRSLALRGRLVTGLADGALVLFQPSLEQVPPALRECPLAACLQGPEQRPVVVVVVLDHLEGPVAGTTLRPTSSR